MSHLSGRNVVHVPHEAHTTPGCTTHLQPHHGHRFWSADPSYAEKFPLFISVDAADGDDQRTLLVAAALHEATGAQVIKRRWDTAGGGCSGVCCAGQVCQQTWHDQGVFWRVQRVAHRTGGWPAQAQS